MIKVTAELVSARTGKTSLLGYAEIVNDRITTQKTQGHRGGYVVRIYRRGSRDRLWKGGRVENFPRKAKGFWDLLYLGLKNIVGDRNK